MRASRFRGRRSPRRPQPPPPCRSPKNRTRPSRNWPLSLQRHAASKGCLPMTDPYVLYYPPTNSYPFLLVSFSADGKIETKPFATEEEAETFMVEEMGLRNPLE